MACEVLGGPTTWGLDIDDSGYRTYSVTHQVAAGLTDGPANVAQCPGLPVPGNTWLFRGDVDVWAWCRPGMSVRPRLDGQEDGWPRLYDVAQTFSNRPPTREQGGRQQPPGQRTDDPLLQPPRITFGSITYTEEAAYDRTGRWLRTSGREQFRGPQVEFEHAKFQVSVQQNLVNPQYVQCVNRTHTVNSTTMWGFPARYVKLSSFNIERLYYNNVFKYYSRTMTYDIAYRYDPNEVNLGTNGYTSGHDRVLADYGNLVLRGDYDRRKDSPTYRNYVVATGLSVATARPGDYVQHIDFLGNPAPTFLDGRGRPWDESGGSTGTGDDEMGKFLIQYYDETDFFTVFGAPATL